MNNEKRSNKGYKIKDSVYKKAMKRADREGGYLSNIIESVVTAYSYGLYIEVKNPENGTGWAVSSLTVADNIDAPAKSKTIKSK